MAGAGVVAGGLHVSGVLETGQVYAKPFDQAYAELASMPMPPTMRQAAGAGDVEVRRTVSSIEWHIRRKDADLYVFTANLSAPDAYHTRVKVNFAVGDALDDQSRRLIGSDYMTSTARLAMTEQLAAELEDRSFDINRFGQKLAVHAQGHPEEMRAFGNEIREMFIHNAETIRANSSADYDLPPAYRQQYETRRSMEAATRPMTQLPVN